MKTRLHEFPYAAFARLRVEQFWPAHFKMYDDSGIECRLGTGDGQMCNVVFFLWPVRQPGEVSEIRLERLEEVYCPADSVRRLLDTVGLETVSTGQPFSEVCDLFGPPVQSSVYMNRRTPEFATPGPWRHTLWFGFSPADELDSMTIVRTDRVRRD